MKIAIVLGMSLALAAAMLLQVPAAAPRPLADLVPAGPLLVLQAKDFSTLVRDWNGSPEKKLWLASDNYEVFSRSRLFLRLGEEQQQFAASAGFTPDMSTLEWIAGGESALALYNIGQLEFLYIARNAPARAMEGLLWKTRGYESRSSAGLPFAVRIDPRTRRVVAFAVAGDLLLAATREDLMAGALSLIAGNPGLTVRSEPWFDQSSRAAGQAGDLRLVMNLEKIARSPHFRSYWIQRNVSQLRPYTAGISDLHRSPGEYREERVLLRAAQSAPVNGAPLGEVLRLAPSGAGLYRAWAAPSADDALDLLERKILAPHPARYTEQRTAPTVSLAGAEAGAEADLETRIDEAPLENAAGRFVPEALRKLLAANSLQAMLEVESSRVMPDGVFTGFSSAVVLLGSAEWSPDAARAALLDAVGSLWTTSALGANWVSRGAYYELDGLTPISVAARGRFLVVATEPKLLASLLDGLSRPSAPAAAYAAGFRHTPERANFGKMMALLDHSSQQERREPYFFSDNIGSLSRTLARVESESIVVREFRYRITRPGFRVQEVTGVTTLIDPLRYPAEELADLYFARWRIEVNFKYLKITLGMDVLKCKKVAEVLKELMMFAMVYNLVRAVMLQAAENQAVQPERISFIDALRWFRQALWTDVPFRLKVNPLRPGRYQPRVRKRRPKYYPLMQKPRQKLLQEMQRQRVMD